MFRLSSATYLNEPHLTFRCKILILMIFHGQKWSWKRLRVISLLSIKYILVNKTFCHKIFTSIDPMNQFTHFD